MRLLQRLLFFVSIIFGLGAVPGAWAQNLLSWELSALSGTTAGSVNSSASAAGIGIGVLSRGSGIAATSTGSAYNSNGWYSSATITTLSDAVTNNDYYQFTVPITSGTFNITAVSFFLQASNTGPGTVTLRSSIDNYTTDLGTASVPTASTLRTVTVNLTGVSGTLTFRLYGYGATAGGGTAGSGGTLRIGSSPTANDNDLIVSGSVSSATPTLTANPTSLTGANGLTYVLLNGPATAPVSVSGTNLTAGGGTITATSSSADFTVSPPAATYTGTSLASTTFTVGLTAGLVVGSAYSASITFAGGGATVVVPVSGTVTAANAPPNLSINDVTAAEGNSGTTTFSFTATLSAPAPAGGVTFDISTQDGSATGGSDYVTQSLTGQTIAPGSTTYGFAVTVNGDAISESTETFSVVVSNVVGANLTDGVGLGTITNDDAAPPTLISTIQGTGTAATTGTFTIQGIVVGVFPTLSPAGFYVQEEDADNDGNVLTSEGIFVNSAASVNIGDQVRLTGTVQENSSTPSFNQAVITPTGTVTVVASGQQSLVTPTSVTLPVTAVADLERYEGMLVVASAGSGSLVVTDNFTLGRFGEVLLAADGPGNQPGTDARLEQFTQFNLPNAANNTAHLANNARRSIILDDGNSTQNPATVIHARGGNPLSATNTLRAGDGVSSITAIMGFGFSAYRLITATGVNFQPTNVRTNAPPSVGGTLKVAGFNVLNYFTDLDNNQNVSIPNSNGVSFEPRGAETADEFTRQRDKIITAITALNPDVLGVIEMENNGTVALQNLVDGLNAIAGAGSYTFVNDANLVNDPNSAPGAVGTDAIKVGFIYKPVSVSPIGLPISSNNAVFSRPPVAQTFRQNSNGGKFTAIVNHFKSKGGTGSGADNDSGDGQGEFNDTRLQQANALIAFIPSVTAAAGDPDVLLLGDYNAYALEDPIRSLSAAGYTSLRPNTDYSYAFDGQFGFLDYAFANPSMTAQVTGSADWHINSDEPIVLDYNTNFKSVSQQSSFYAPDPFKASDHDPVLVGLNLTPPLTATLVASTSVVCPSTPVTLSATVAGLAGATYSLTITNGTNQTTATGLSASAVSVTLTPTVPGAFTLTVLTSTSATASAVSGTVIINAVPSNASLTSGTLICSQTSVTLAASATDGTSYTFANSSGTISSTGNLAAVTTTGNYTVTISNASGCTASATATVGQSLTLPAFSVNSATTCAGTAATLTASGCASGSISWPTAFTGTGLSRTISPTTTTVYDLTCTVGTCTTTASGTVTVNPTPAAPTYTLTSNGTVCAGNALTVTANGCNAGTVSFTINPATQSGFVTPGPPAFYVFAANTPPGTYTVCARCTENGCTSPMAITTVTINSLPAATLTANSTVICTNSSVTLTAGGGTNYAFAGPGFTQTGSTSTAVVTTSGTYSVVVTNASGCTAVASLSIAQTASGVVIGATPGTVNACTGSPLAIPVNVSGSVSAYYWLKGGNPIPGQNTNTLSIPSVQSGDAGTYSLSVVGACGSATSSPIMVVVNPTPTITLVFPGGTLINPTSVPTIQLSTPGQVQVSVSGGTLYEWVLILDRINGYEIRQAESNTSGVFTISKPGPYRITVNPGSACSRTVQGLIVN